MSEMGVFRIVRYVRRGGGLARTLRPEQGGGTSPESMFSIGHVAAQVGMLAMTPTPLGMVALAALAISLVVSVVGPSVSGQAPPPWYTADQTRQWTLVKLYGQEMGNEIYNNERSHRSIEVDLRTKVP